MYYRRYLYKSIYLYRTKKKRAIAGAVVAVFVLLGLLFVAVYVPIKYSLDHPITTSTCK